MRTSIRIACSLAAAVALLATYPATAAAAAKKLTIKPTALTPYITQQLDYRFTVCSGGDATFWATLKLPVGAKITGLSYRRFAFAATETDVGIFRVQPGKVPAKERIYAAPGSEVSPDIGTGTIVTGTFIGPTKKVQAGWDYYVLARSGDRNTWIGDIVVKYETP